MSIPQPDTPLTDQERIVVLELAFRNFAFFERFDDEVFTKLSKDQVSYLAKLISAGTNRKSPSFQTGREGEGGRGGCADAQ